jgi:hypothetical protein
MSSAVRLTSQDIEQALTTEKLNEMAGRDGALMFGVAMFLGVIYFLNPDSPAGSLKQPDTSLINILSIVKKKRDARY